MKIAIGCDHGGFELKEHLRKALMAWTIESPVESVKDFGCPSEESVDYPDIAHELCSSVENGENDLGILICGSGNGINMSANSHSGVRSALCWKPEIASLAREHNNANVMALPGRFIDLDTAWDCVREFLLSEFEGGRHQRRIDKIKHNA